MAKPVTPHPSIIRSLRHCPHHSPSPSGREPFQHRFADTNLHDTGLLLSILHNTIIFYTIKYHSMLHCYARYPHEKQIEFTPLTGMEVMSFRVDDEVLVVTIRPAANLQAKTIEEARDLVQGPYDPQI